MYRVSESAFFLFLPGQWEALLIESSRVLKKLTLNYLMTSEGLIKQKLHAFYIKHSNLLSVNGAPKTAVLPDWGFGAA